MGPAIRSTILVSDLFEAARRAARESRLAQIRAHTRTQQMYQQQQDEAISREHNLRRMRDMSSAQLGMIAARSGMPPLGLYGQIHPHMIQTMAGSNYGVS